MPFCSYTQVPLWTVATTVVGLVLALHATNITYLYQPFHQNVPQSGNCLNDTAKLHSAAQERLLAFGT